MTTASITLAPWRHMRWNPNTTHARRCGHAASQSCCGQGRRNSALAALSGEKSGASAGETGKKVGASAGDSSKDVWKKNRSTGGPGGAGGHGMSTGVGSPAGAASRGQSRAGKRAPRQGERQQQRRGRATPEPHEQVEFTGPVPTDPHVAILGGGISGLACAQALAEAGIRSTVFDTGRHGLGGRMGTREVYVDPATGRERKGTGVPDFVFDHAAQYFTVSDARFADVMEDWIRRGWVRGWDGCLGTLQPGAGFRILQDSPNAREKSMGSETGAMCRNKQEARVLVTTGAGHAASAGEPDTRATSRAAPQATASSAADFFESLHLHGTRFIASRGMRALCDELGAAVGGTGLASVERPIWITKMLHKRGSHADKWRLIDEHGTERGLFDFVVIAHNGKCANRLLIPSGVPLVARQMMRLQLNSIWCSMVAFAAPLPVPGSPGSALQSGAESQRGQAPMEAAFVEGMPALAWMCNNTAKLAASHGPALNGSAKQAATAERILVLNGSAKLAVPGGSGLNGAAGTDKSPECWTLFSSAAYGKANKVPQERIPAPVAERVRADMLEALSQALGIALSDLPPVLHHRVQLWGAALPLNVPSGVEFICDGPGRVGVCGDWLINPSVEAAVISGRELAAHISRAFGPTASDPGCMSVGLEAPLCAVKEAHDIGHFA